MLNCNSTHVDRQTSSLLYAIYVKLVEGVAKKNLIQLVKKN